MRSASCIRPSNIIGNSHNIHAILNTNQLVCQQIPKGFGKYFENDKNPNGKNDPGNTTGTKDISDKNVQDELIPPGMSPESKPSGSSFGEKKNPKSSAQSNNDWIFGIFKPKTENGGGSGRPLNGGDSNNDREKLLIIGAVGFASFLGLLGLLDGRYEEIGWKEFVNR